MFKTIDNITIEEVNAAAETNSEKYCNHYTQNVARVAFIEGVMWAQKEYGDSNRPKYTAQP